MLGKNLLFIGAINFGNNPQGGEEFKNQLIVNKLLKEGYKLDFIDTISWKSSPLTLFRLFICVFVFSYNKIIISASSKSVYLLIKYMYFLNRKKLTKTIYFVIGGYFPEALRLSIYKPKYYFLLEKIIVEGELLKEKLSRLGLTQNVELIPNFKETILHQSVLSRKSELKQKRFIYISTISSEKGVDLIFNALEIILQEQNIFEYSFDFFGPIDKNYQNTFRDRLTEFSNNTAYKGYLDIMNDPKSSYELLMNYEALIFPTMYEGEGFAGVFIDAFISGLPIITTNWNMNREVVKNGYTGLILEENTPECLAEAILLLTANESLRSNFSYNSRMAAVNYDINLIFENNLKKLLD